MTADASAALLWTACRREPDPEAVVRALDDGADPGVVVPLALTNGLGPLLWRSLQAAGRPGALGPQGRWLRQISDISRVQAALMLPRVVGLSVGPLVEAGMEPVIWKGPWVAQRYPAPGLRPMADVDLLLPAADHRRALDVLCRVGWRVERARTVDYYDSVLRHPEVPDLALELHARQEVAHRRVTKLDAANLWGRRLPMTVQGTPAFVLPPEEEVVALARHAGKPGHGFRRLVSIADLAVVCADWAARGTPVDWDRVRAVADASRCSTVVAVALSLGRRAGLDVPDGFTLPSRGWRARALAPLLQQTWPLRTPADEDFVLKFALTDLALARLRLLVGSRHVASEGSVVRWALDVPGETTRRARQLVAATRR